MNSTVRTLSNHWKELVFFLVLVGGVFAGYVLSGKSQDNRQQASVANGTAILDLTPGSSTLSPNTPAQLTLTFNAQNELVDGIQVVAYITGNVAPDLAFTAIPPTGLNQIVNRMTPIAGGFKFEYALLAPAGGAAYTTAGNQVTIGTLTFTTPASGTLQVNFDPSQTMTTRAGSAQDILKTPTDTSYTFASTAAGAKLSLSDLAPANPQEINRTFITTIVLDTAGQEVSGVDAQLVFNPAVLRVDAITPTTGNEFATFPIAEFDNTQGTISLAGYISSASSAVNGSAIPVAQITFTPLAAATTTDINFLFTPGNKNDSNVASYVAPGQESVDLLASVQNQVFTINPLATAVPTVQPTAAPTTDPTAAPTVEPTAAPTASPTAAPTAVSTVFKLGFQGRQNTTADKTKNITVRSQFNGQATVTTTATTNALGEFTLALLPGEYLFLIESAGYLDRGYGTTTTPVVVPTQPSVIDLTNRILLGGDFNNDNVVNEVDYSLSFMNALGTNNPVVDLDGSGSVNSLDYALMRSNWTLTADAF